MKYLIAALVCFFLIVAFSPLPTGKPVMLRVTSVTVPTKQAVATTVPVATTKPVPPSDPYPAPYPAPVKKKPKDSSAPAAPTLALRCGHCP